MVRGFLTQAAIFVCHPVIRKLSEATLHALDQRCSIKTLATPLGQGMNSLSSTQSALCWE